MIDKRYYLTSVQFEGEIELGYCAEGYLVRFENRGNLDRIQRAWLLNHIPIHLNDLEELKTKSKTVVITLVKQAISFDDFWNRYDHKAVSSKKKTLAAWQRMPEAERIKAYNYIYRYLQNLPNGVAKKYAETYLNSQVWNN